MNILDITNKKMNKKELSKEELEYFVQNYTNGIITDEEAAELVRAIYSNNMTKEEITNLTIAMANSGEVLDLSEFGNVVDKHSTGGVGDKITLILIPIIASLGIPVAKMSGRGLGFTGGTADKIEAIPGYRTDLSEEEFRKSVKEIGISLITQTANLAPADKKIYALRDEIGCTDNIGLIASSIMSKKIAAGANKIVLDVTCGSGAFMKNKEDAVALSKTMKDIGELAGKEVVCIITNMDEPLGRAVGNTLELIETIEALNGRMEEDIKEVVLEIGSYMVKLAGNGNDIEENKEKIMMAINSGSALNKFKEMVINQGGDITYIDDLERFEKAKYSEDIILNKEGYINRINAELIGKLSVTLGAGRIKKEDNIDMTAGLVFNKKVGDYINKEEKIVTLYSNDKNKIEMAKNIIKDAIEISNNKSEKIPMILDVI